MKDIKIIWVNFARPKIKMTVNFETCKYYDCTDFEKEGWSEYVGKHEYDKLKKELEKLKEKN